MLQVVAIDGISGSGKSSTARLLAKELGFLHLDTGSMYRLHASLALESGLKVGQHLELENLAKGLDFSFDTDGGLLANGKALPDSIRSPAVSAVVSEYCKPAGVREAMARQQRKLGSTAPCVVEGRDIGTVVFPDAPWKIFMTARPEVRAQRRAKEWFGGGLEIRTEEVAQNLLERDVQDSTRAHSPLRKAGDALELDTSDLTLERQVAILANLVRNGSA